MNKLFKLLALISITAGMTSCGVSLAEKEQRRANAFDIEGRYLISTNQNENDETILDIKNETDRSNVFGTVERSNFTKEEEAAFKRQNISLNDVEKFRTQFKIGVGVHGQLAGGENISDDLGNSSRLLISTSGTESVFLGKDTIRYLVSANIAKSDFTLKGKLIMQIEHLDTVTDSKTGATTTTLSIKELVEIPFTAKNSEIFFNQYMGVWNGKIYSDSTAINTVLLNISISKIDNLSFEVKPAKTTFEFKGESFVFNKISKDIDDLAKNEFPEINIEFIGNQGSKIEVMGNIYSLGMFSGVISKIDLNKNNEQIGNFQYKRN